jgi:hypothetical protein
MVNMDGKRKKTVSSTFFWNAFLPILLFVVVGGILFFVMMTPDSVLPASPTNYLEKGVIGFSNIMRGRNSK